MGLRHLSALALGFGFEFRVEGLRFNTEGLEFEAGGLGFRVETSGCSCALKVWASVFRV